MSAHTVVSVYGVDPAGETGRAVGSGSLVDPMFVLIHPPLSEHLARAVNAGVPPRLRLAIGSFGGTDSVVEVIDARDVHVPKTSVEEPIVGVSLTRAAKSAPTALRLSGGAVDLDTMIGVLGEHLRQEQIPAAEGVADALGGIGDTASGWLCNIWDPPPWFCQPHGPDPGSGSERTGSE